MTPRAAALAALLAAAACSRTTQVREPEAKPEGAPEEAPEAPRGRGTGAGIPPEPGRPRVPAAPEGLFAPGVVADIQRALADRGLLGRHREGVLDDPTSGAIRRLQRERGLAETGFPDREALKALGIEPERAYLREEDRERTEGRR